MVPENVSVHWTLKALEVLRNRALSIDIYLLTKRTGDSLESWLINSALLQLSASNLWPLHEAIDKLWSVC